MNKTLGGWMLIGGAILLGLYNMTDMIGDLKTWHGLADPSFVGPAFKAFLSPLVAALGGTMLPQLGSKE